LLEGNGNEAWQTSKEQQRYQDMFTGRSTTMHNRRQNISIGYIFSVSSKQQLLCFVHNQGQKSKQKHTTKI